MIQVFIWDFIAGVVLDQIMEWIYNSVVGFLGELFSLMGDMALALKRKERQYKKYLKHGADIAAAKVAAEIETMEAELKCEQELYDLTFN